MCGIAGTFRLGQYARDDVTRMVECISYRGPDEQDVIEVGPCVLGHARLAVVDPENGGQPMSNHDDTVWVVFNGEIYNFVELREDLKAKGYIFKSRCDTEVLVHLWREKGPAMLDDLIGMFAFFLWDTRENRGLLARDRQGIKPCYIMEIGDGLVFASEIKAILSLPGIERKIDDVGLNMMHHFNYCPPPRTCVKGISHLEPGSCMILEGDGSRRKLKYWTWPFDAPKQPLEEEEFSALLDDAIRLQMRFDVEGCLFLSGGVDSSIIGGHLQAQWNRSTLRTYSLDTQVEGFGEVELARHAAEELGIEISPIQYDWNIVPENIVSVLHHADQPHGDFSFFLIRELCARAHADDVIVAFNGDGPDEVLSGFGHNQRYFRNLPPGEFSPADYFKNICYFSENSREKLLTPEFRETAVDPEDIFEDLLRPWRGLDPVDQIAAYECTTLGPGNNLIKTDRMGAGMSIEGRSPFLDHRISEVMARMPIDAKQRDNAGKYFLKRFGQRRFGEEHMFRPKSMPTMPIGEWIKGPLAGWAEDSLRGLDPSRYNVPAVLGVFHEHKAGVANHTRELRTLLMASHWI